MSVRAGYDPQNLAEVGWGLLLAADADPRILKSLEPLIRLRKEQTKSLLRIFDGPNGVRENESAREFLNRQKAMPGMVDPQIMPYYLLIVASPEKVSFAFQSQLAVQYAVGRLWFDDLAAFAAYAAGVVLAELQPRPAPAEAVLFSPTHPGDFYTAQLALALGAILPASADPLSLKGPILPSGWQISRLLAGEARKTRLVEQLAAPGPRLVLAAGHSLVYLTGSSDSAEARENQGSLVCADWQGPQERSDLSTGEVSFEIPWPLKPQDHCFGAQDVDAAWDLSGRIFFFYGSYSLGTPKDALAGHGKPFLAALPQRLLSLEGGAALGFYGCTEQVWGFSEASQLSGTLADLTELVIRLAEGQPAGLASEGFANRYADLASRQADLSADYRYRPELGGRLAEAWVGMNNARSLQFFGDPAARLLVGASQTQPLSVIDLAQAKTSFPEPAPALSDYTTLELVLARSDPTKPSKEYDLRMRLTWPEGSDRQDAELQWKAALELGELGELRGLPDSYATALTASLFGDSAASTLFTGTTMEGEGLQIIITIDASAGELHSLAWELLKSPWDQAFLLQKISVSRRPVQRPVLPAQVRRTARPRALAAISSPVQQDKSPIRLGERTLLTVDVAAELQRAQQVLGDLAQVETLASSPDQPGQLSSERLHRALLQDYEILYLVAHSHLWIDPKDPAAAPMPIFLFESSDGQSKPVEAKRLASRLGSLSPDRRPRLVVLMPPQTAGYDSAGAGLLEAASSFVQVGVSAVVTFQIAISMESQSSFLAAFFDSLGAGTSAGEAVAQGRAAIQTRPDWWAPVLYASRADSILWTPGEPKPGLDRPPADIRILINRSGIADYTVSLAAPLEMIVPTPLRLDFNSLRAAQLSPESYGKLLSKAIFNDPTQQNFWKGALTANYQPDYQGLQVSIEIDRSAAELHEFAWETLYDLESETFLAMAEDLAFNRRVASLDWQKFELRPRDKLKMLLAVANPPIEGRTQVSRISYSWKPEEEADLARQAAQGLIEQTVDLRQQSGLVSLDTLMEGLAQGCDIFLLVCMSVLRSEVANDPNSPRRLILALDSPGGQPTMVEANQLVEIISNLAPGNRPRLVILAGADTASALGPRLCEIGVPQVIGMQRNISVKTFHQFLPIFFAELARDGDAGRALAVARSILRDHMDWHMLVLYSRLRSGKIWRL